MRSLGVDDQGAYRDLLTMSHEFCCCCPGLLQEVLGVLVCIGCHRFVWVVAVPWLGSWASWLQSMLFHLSGRH